MNEELKNAQELNVSFISSLLLTLSTIIGFGFAMIAIPPAGPYCPDTCMEYPYAELLNYFPRDYLWMYIISFQLLVFLIFVIASYFNTAKNQKIYSFISVAFAIITTTLLLTTYFVQYTVVPISMIKGQTDGIALLTQYNGNGIFIASEELGYILMSFSLLFLSPIFTGKCKVERALKYTCAIPSVLIVISFVFYTIHYGLHRDYRFEVAAITIDWIAIITIGILSCVFFNKEIRKTKNGRQV
jgi:hypothetical protein